MINVFIRILQLKKLKTTGLSKPLHFIGKEVEAQRSTATCPRTHSNSMAETELETRKQIGAQAKGNRPRHFQGFFHCQLVSGKLKSIARFSAQGLTGSRPWRSSRNLRRRDFVL